MNGPSAAWKGLVLPVLVLLLLRPTACAWVFHPFESLPEDLKTEIAGRISCELGNSLLIVTGEHGGEDLLADELPLRHDMWLGPEFILGFEVIRCEAWLNPHGTDARHVLRYLYPRPMVLYCSEQGSPFYRPFLILPDGLPKLRFVDRCEELDLSRVKLQNDWKMVFPGGSPADATNLSARAFARKYGLEDVVRRSLFRQKEGLVFHIRDMALPPARIPPGAHEWDRERILFHAKDRDWTTRRLVSLSRREVSEIVYLSYALPGSQDGPSRYLAVLQENPDVLLPVPDGRMETELGRRVESMLGAGARSFDSLCEETKEDVVERIARILRSAWLLRSSLRPENHWESLDRGTAWTEDFWTMNADAWLRRPGGGPPESGPIRLSLSMGRNRAVPGFRYRPDQTLVDGLPKLFFVEPYRPPDMESPDEPLRDRMFWDEWFSHREGDEWFSPREVIARDGADPALVDSRGLRYFRLLDDFVFLLRDVPFPPPLRQTVPPPGKESRKKVDRVRDMQKEYWIPSLARNRARTGELIGLSRREVSELVYLACVHGGEEDGSAAYRAALRENPDVLVPLPEGRRETELGLRLEALLRERDAGLPSCP